MKAVEVVIHGRVQGVGFRWNVRRIALGLGLKGWVRNADDGAVHALFAGSESAVEEMIGWCRRGPTAARVTSLDEHTIDAKDVQRLEGFGIE